MLPSLIVGHLVPGGLLILVRCLCHSSPLSGSFDHKAVILCDISMVHQTTGVNYSGIKLTIVSHLIQMLCFNKEAFRNMEYISLLLKLRRLNKAWQRPVIRGNEAAVRRTLSSCHRWASVKFDRLEQDCGGSHV